MLHSCRAVPASRSELFSAGGQFLRSSCAQTCAGADTAPYLSFVGPLDCCNQTALKPSCVQALALLTGKEYEEPEDEEEAVEEPLWFTCMEDFKPINFIYYRGAYTHCALRTVCIALLRLWCAALYIFYLGLYSQYCTAVLLCRSSPAPCTPFAHCVTLVPPCWLCCLTPLYCHNICTATCCTHCTAGKYMAAYFACAIRTGEHFILKQYERDKMLMSDERGTLVLLALLDVDCGAAIACFADHCAKPAAGVALSCGWISSWWMTRKSSYSAQCMTC